MNAALRVLVFVLGSLAVAQFFVPHAVARWVETRLLDWLMVLEFAALLAGVTALVRRQLHRVKELKTHERVYPALVLAGFGIMILVGLIEGIGNGTVFDILYTSVLQPVQAAVMSLLAFYMASAVFRSFRLTSAPATILLLSSLIVILGRVPLGDQLVPKISLFATWIIRVPNVAATRGLWIGIGLAGSATALRVILGIQGPGTWNRR